MANAFCTKVAETILADRRGADYYQAADILAGYLKGQFAATSEAASQAAEAILQDRQSADYYQDPEMLAGFLEGRLGPGQ
jgi:hypothetical protein